MASMTKVVEKKALNPKKAEASVAFITIGRWEPPHKGHEVIGTRTIDAARNYNRNYARQMIKYLEDKGNPVHGYLIFMRKWGYGDNAPSVPYMWTSPVGDHDIPTDERNPLTTLQRLYYLKRFYPKRDYPDLKFLIDLNNTGLGFEELLNTGHPSGLTNNKMNPYDKSRRPLPSKWDEMTPCQKYKYENILDWRQSSHSRWHSGIKQTRKSGIDLQLKRDGVSHSSKPKSGSSSRVSESRRLPSKQCLEYLAKEGFKEVSIVVGSDRAEAFKKYNQDHFNRLFGDGKGTVVTEGDDRKKAGRMEEKEIEPSSFSALLPISPPRSRQALATQAKKNNTDAIECIMKFVGDDGERKKGEDEEDEGIDLCRKMEDLDLKEKPAKETMEETEKAPLTISKEDSQNRATTYSGTWTRRYAYDENVDEFIEAVKVKDMTLFDCYCLMNDIRCWGQLGLKNQYQLKSSNLTPLDLSTFNSKIKNKATRLAFTREVREMKRKNRERPLSPTSPYFRPPQTIQYRGRQTPNISSEDAQTRDEFGILSPQMTHRPHSPGGGTRKVSKRKRRRKTRRKKKRKTRRRRKKRRKSIKKLKVRLTKHRKKKLKKWKVKKTRKN